MSFAGEATLSVVFEALFAKLTCSETLHFLATEKQIHEELNKWKKILRNIQAVLADAEEKQMKDMQVKIWLAELQDLAYDVDDILDEFVTEASGSKLMEEYHQANRSKVRKIIHNFTTKFRPNAFLFSYKMMAKIKAISVRLQELVIQKCNLQLRGIDVDRLNKRVIERPPSTSLVNETLVYVREDDKRAIIDLLLKNDNNSDDADGEVSVISIVGIGGIGKTTLAQLVYNDDSIKHHFDIKVWVCVSQDFDILRITKTILQSITSEACNDVNDLNLLQVKLKEKLSKKKFLLVLDDMWNESYNDWTVLRSPFEVGAPGSKIIVTTRNQNVSSIMRSFPDYLLKELSNDDCLFILAQHSLGEKDFSGHSDLREIGEQIVNKCNGLPLAAKTIGGLLRTKVDPDAWKDVLENEIWNSSEEKGGIIPALWLSYYHFPPHLKQCFCYCSIFPKGYEFGEEEVVLLWMAEGFLKQANTKRRTEKLGSMYFQDLVSRSFFQRSSRNKSRFVMHDLINDLAQLVAGDICFRVEGDKQSKISSHARYSSYIANRYDGLKKFGTFYEAERLRTFLPFMSPKDGEYCFLTTNVLFDLLPKLRRLRVLSLEGYYITELPNSVGDLRHIRYLNFSYTKIKSLPDSICTLFNLQTLLLKGCDRLKQLPSNLRFLINLRHLDITDANSIEGMPLGVGDLINLQVLSNFLLGQGIGYQIRELKNLSDLKGELCISGLQNLVNAQDALEGRLFEKSGLDDLEMKWGADLKDGSRMAGVEKEVLSLLEPHKKLNKLTIKCYGGLTFPTWIGDPSFKNLMSLNFEYCQNCTSLPSLGKLTFLKALYIKGMSNVNRVGVEFYGENCSNAFPSLEILHFEEMSELKEWNHYQIEETGSFNCLRSLSVKKCPKLLGSLPSCLPCLEKLVIHDCQLLAVSVPNSPHLCELEILGCKEVIHESSLDLCSLKKVSLSNIRKFTCPEKGLMLGLTKTEYLRIGGCGELTSLLQNRGGWLAESRCLRNLEILNCPQLISMEIGMEKEDVLQLETLCNLEYLRIKHCEKLLKLTITLYSLTSLRELEIVKCPKLVSFSSNSLPPTLKGLVIKNCENLQCLLEEDSINMSSKSLLNHLTIERCPSLTSLSSRGELPVRLQDLRIWSCSKLANLSSSGQLPVGLKQLKIDLCQSLESIAHSVHENTSLEFIFIVRCEKIQYLPDGLNKLSHLQHFHVECFRNLVCISRLPSTSLRVFRLCWCRKLQTLPSGMHNLTSLQELEISNCPYLITFPEEGFPTNLTSLTISKSEILEGLLGWGLHKLTCLKKLTINGGYTDGMSFPNEEKGMMLPSSLRKLAISDFPNVEILSSKGFQNFSSLECLCIVNFPKLKSLPRKDTLLSLLELYIHNCPLLKQRWKKDEGQDWCNIAHIPFVQIDDRFINDSEEEEEEEGDSEE